MDPLLRDKAIRLAYRVGLARVGRNVAALVSRKARAERAKNRADLEKLEPELVSIRRQLHQGIANANGVALLISMDGVSNVLLQLPVIAGVVAHGLEPVMILPSRASREQRLLYKRCGIQRFAYWDEFPECQEYASVLATVRTCRSQDELLQITWRGIAIGKYAVSTLMRRLRSGTINPSDPNIRKQLEAVIRRALDHASASVDLLDEWKPELAVFIDRGYTPEGPLFEACLQRGIRPATMNSAHRDNALILKRYRAENFNVHPVALSNDTWSRLLDMPWNATAWEQVRTEIEYCYRSGQWYGEVATQFNTHFLDRHELKEKLKLDPQKRTVLLFPHIFWDATFFWGTDVFQDYEEWFRESVRVAWHTDSVNWIIKIHPANVVKNLRDGTDVEHSEMTVLKEFGDIPPHIYVLPAETDISTLSLYEVGDICLTVRGTVGIEAAAMGLTVVTAGTGRYDRLGFTHDVETPEQYLHVLENIADIPPPSAEQVELARRYAYGAFLLRPLDAEAIRFSYSKSREARLEVRISERAVESLLACDDVQAIKSWLDDGSEDTASKQWRGHESAKPGVS